MAITLAAGINATQEDVTLSAALAASPGDLFRLGNEVVQFGGYGRRANNPRLPDPSRKRVIFQRGVGTTAAASHAGGVSVLAVVDGLVAGADEVDPSPFVAPGAGGVTVTDGVTTVEVGTLNATAVTEDNPDEATIIALPPGVTYDADELELLIDGTLTVGIVFVGDGGARFLDLRGSGITIAKNGGSIYLTNDDQSVDTFRVATSSGAMFVLGGATTPGKRVSVLSEDLNTEFLGIDADGKIGFSGAAPVARPEVPNTPTEQDIVDALVALGLITQAAP